MGNCCFRLSKFSTHIMSNYTMTLCDICQNEVIISFPETICTVCDYTILVNQPKPKQYVKYKPYNIDIQMIHPVRL